MNIILASISLIAAGFAGWQAFEARRSRIDAKDAEGTSLRIAAALEMQAAAQDALVKQSTVGDWSPLENVEGMLFKTFNTSGKALTVVSISTVPEHASPLVHSRTRLPAIVVQGGTLRLIVTSRLGLSVSDVIIHWTDEKKNPGETTLSV